MAPEACQSVQRAEWTEAGRAYRAACGKKGVEPKYEGGVHFQAMEETERILFPDIPALHGLRHCWCWERRPRLHLPTWSFAKVPRASFSPEENARLLSVYMRPWTLNPLWKSEMLPLLSDLGKCSLVEGVEKPVWLHVAESSVHHSSGVDEATSVENRAGGRGSAQDGSGVAMFAAAGQESLAASGQEGKPSKRRRKAVQNAELTAALPRYSYAASWEHYIDGHVVSETSQRYIVNLLAATAASEEAHQGDSSDDSEEETWRAPDVHAGNMDIVRRALTGIASRSAEEGEKGCGRYAQVIRLGRAIWETAPVSDERRKDLDERCFEEGCFPPREALKKKISALARADEDRPAPYAARTVPFALLSVVNYELRIREWRAKIQTEEEAPTPEQNDVLDRVMHRVLTEFRLLKVGSVECIVKASETLF